MRTFINLYRLRRDCGWTFANAVKSAWKLTRSQT